MMSKELHWALQMDSGALCCNGMASVGHCVAMAWQVWGIALQWHGKLMAVRCAWQ